MGRLGGCAHLVALLNGLLEHSVAVADAIAPAHITCTHTCTWGPRTTVSTEGHMHAGSHACRSQQAHNSPARQVKSGHGVQEAGGKTAEPAVTECSI
jgi:hypothetical protein